MNTIEIMLDAAQLAVSVLKGYPQSMAREDALITLRNAIKHGEAELRREPDATIVQNEYGYLSTQWSVPYIPNVGDKLYTREEIK